MLLPFTVKGDDIDYIGVIPIALVGLGFILFFTTIWTIIPDIVTDPKILGTAFGIGSIFYNLQAIISPIVGSYLHDKYEYQENSNNGYF